MDEQQTTNNKTFVSDAPDNSSSRPQIPPKPDKIIGGGPTINISNNSNGMMEQSNNPIPPRKISSDTGTGTTGGTGKPPLLSPKPSIGNNNNNNINKPALPPKPSNNNTRNSTSSSSSVSPLKDESPPPPILPKGRTGLSIANAILANANANKNQNLNRNTSPASPAKPPAPPLPTSPRPRPLTTLGPARPPGIVPASIRVKSASLGRGVVPPTSPTLSSSSLSQFFSSKAASLARILPLDLNLGSASSGNSFRTSSSIPLRKSTSSSQVPRRTTFPPFPSSGEPPPPPPRRNKKLSPPGSLSPVLASPSMEEPPTSPDSLVIYAQIDKDKKWKERKLKEDKMKEMDITVEKVKEEASEEGVKGSLVITINRGGEEQPNDNKQEEEVPLNQIIITTDETDNKEPISQNNDSSQPPRESVGGTVINSWLGKYLNDPSTGVGVASESVGSQSNWKHDHDTVDNNDESINGGEIEDIQNSQDEPEVRVVHASPKNKEEPEVRIVYDSPKNKELLGSQPEELSSLSERKSFLFAHLNTTDDKDKNIKDDKPRSDENGNSGSDNDNCKTEIAESLQTKIQSVVSRLSNLSGKCSPTNNEEDKDSSSSGAVPLPVKEVEEILAITEEEDKHKDKDTIDSPNANLLDVTTPQSAPILRRRSWNCGGPDNDDNSISSSISTSSSSSLTQMRERSNTQPNNPSSSLCGWVDEGDSTGVLGDVDTCSDAPKDKEKNSSAEDIIRISGRRKKNWLFSSFGKGGGGGRSSSNSSNNNSPNKKGRNTKSNSLFVGDSGSILARVVSGPILSVPFVYPSPPTEEKVKDKTSPGNNNNNNNNGSPSKSHRYSEGSISLSSIGDASELLNPLPESQLFQSPQNDDESVSSFTSSNPSQNNLGFEDILAELTSPQERKVFYVAREILTSEQTFLDVLDLLTVQFPSALRRHEESIRHPIIAPQDLDFILGGLPNLKRVNQELREDLYERISNWRENQKIADVIRKKGPFLKLYAGYIKTFEKMTQRLDELCQQNLHFLKALRDFEMSDACHKLGLKHFMLKPVQRMPQYRLLLEDYLKHLEEGSCDYEDTLKALEIVKEVAEHANEAIRLQVNAEKLMQLQSRLGTGPGGKIIMKADRQLLKEGELLKVCRKDLQPRFFALMNDCLLYMSYAIAATVGDGDLKFRNELPLAGMKVSISQKDDYQYEFTVVSETRSFNLVAKSARERDEWMKALQNAIMGKTCRTPGGLPEDGVNEGSFPLGKIAPVWIQDSRVTMCQRCSAPFNFAFRRHHCRACGKVVCKHCSGNDAPLQYNKYEPVRVCNDCYEYLLDEFDRASASYDGIDASRESIRSRFTRTIPNVSVAKRETHLCTRLVVPASDPGSRISGYLHWRERKAWKRRWFVLRDRVLYIYAASEDIVAQKGIPVLGWTVDFEKSECMEGGDCNAVFKLSHKGQPPHLFQADSPTTAERWVEAMKDATVLLLG